MQKMSARGERKQSGLRFPSLPAGRRGPGEPLGESARPFPQEGTLTLAAAFVASLVFCPPLSPEQGSLLPSFTWKQMCLRRQEMQGGWEGALALPPVQVGEAFPERASVSKTRKKDTVLSKEGWRGSCVFGFGEEVIGYGYSVQACASSAVLSAFYLVWCYLWVYFASPTRRGAGAGPRYCYK